ncbi:threonylcarbamoyl-AMP synthase [Clostridiaceae bacterium NSJ-33]|uniref:Threonylcarbamoyl-AMP synthase n=2 Tax=Fumia xinanensis TaxID=2763659 RepID=A0A926E6V8_9FIRM|nr:threonylcarbamoyl-AMP synthase [Fumia xinanensis]
METQLLPASPESIARAAALLKEGSLIGLPTETVYGLAADALNPAAVRKIFAAKGRPQDNPLIVHICDLSMMETLTSNPPELTYELAKAFWPGPMTMVLPKATCLSDEVTAGLPTVGIRFPAHPAAQAIIRESGLPLAAPSANLSGSPSPTRASHVYDDLQGKIPLIIDGGACAVGLESTVIAVMEDRIRLLRPGGITAEQLRAYAPVEIDDGVLHQLDEGTKAASPGMKYKHYSPKAKVIIVDAPLPDFASFVNARRENGVYAMVFDGEEALLQVPTLSFGVQDDQPSQAKVLFDSLRRCDELGAKTVYVRAPQKDGIGLAVYNRLLRAAGFTVVGKDGNPV